MAAVIPPTRWQRVRTALATFATAYPDPAPAGAELLIADTRIWMSGLGFKFTPYNPDILVQKKGGLRVYDEMRTDDQVKACLWLTKAALIGPGWTLEPPDDSAEAKTVAEGLTDNLEHLDNGSLEDTCVELLTAFDYGFAVSEKRYEPEENGGIRLQALKAKAPHDLDFECDGYGNLLAITQRQGGTLVRVDPTKVVHFANQMEFGNYYGRSMLREAYTPWWHKKNIVQWWAIFLEKMSIPPVYGTHPAAARGAPATEVLNQLKRLQAATAMTVEEGWTLQYLESTRDPKLVFQAAVEDKNLGISRAILLPEKSGYSGAKDEGGSYSLAQTQFGVWLFVLQLWQRRLQRTLQQQLIDELAELVSPGMPPPQLRFLPLTDEDKYRIAELWNQCVTSGAVIPELEDENHLRRSFKMPERTSTEPPPGKQTQVLGDLEEEPDPKEEMAQRMDFIVRHEGSQWVLYAHDGKVLGRHATEAEAEAQERAIEAAKHRRDHAEGDFWRPLTPQEQRADLSEKRRILEALTRDEGTALADALAAIARDVVKRGAKVEGATAIRNLTASQALIAAARKVLEAGLRTAYTAGQRTASGEVVRAGGPVTLTQRQTGVLAQFQQRGGLVGSRATDFFRAKAFWVTGLAVDDILKRAQGVLFNSLKQDKTAGQVQFELDQAVGDYLPQLDAAGRAVNVPARVETIARTNLGEALNEGRWAAFTDPDLEGFITMVRYSAVMDDRTRERHAAWDGVTRPVNDPVWFGPPDNRPPGGYNCRCVLVPISAADDVVPTPDGAIPSEPASDPGFR